MYFVIYDYESNVELFGITVDDKADLPSHPTDWLAENGYDWDGPVSRYIYRLIQEPAIPKYLGLASGNVVRWSGSLWIVSKTKNIPNDRYVTLLSFSSSRVSAGVSDAWPEDPRERIGSIEWQAGSVKDFITQALTKLLGF